MRRFAALAVILLSVAASGCALTPSHRFAQPSRDWIARHGQLAYRGKKRAIIGEVLVRFSAQDDFELIFSKGPGVTLLVMHTDSDFARIEGPLAGLPWSGKMAETPPRVRGWLKLRQELLRNPTRQNFRVEVAAESFVLRF